MLRAASIKQEPFSVFHNRRQTSRSDHTVVGRRSNAAQWVHPGTARVYAHYHVTVTLRLNGFPPSFKNWHTVRAGLSGFYFTDVKGERTVCFAESGSRQTLCEIIMRVTTTLQLLQFPEENCKKFFFFFN